MTNNKNGKIVGVESRKVVNENKDGQLTYNTVSRGEKNDDIIKDVVLESKAVSYTHLDVYKRQVCDLSV